MRHSDITDIYHANDNPAPSGTLDLFEPREIVIGPLMIGDRIPGLEQHVDGMVVIHEILDRGEDPMGAASRSWGVTMGRQIDDDPVSERD